LNAYKSVEVKRKFGVGENKVVFLLRVGLVVLVLPHGHANNHIVGDRVATVKADTQLTSQYLVRISDSKPISGTVAGSQVKLCSLVSTHWSVLGFQVSLRLKLPVVA